MNIFHRINYWLRRIFTYSNPVLFCLFVICIILYGSCGPSHIKWSYLDEKKILKDSRAAFAKQVFNKAYLSKSEEFLKISRFLVRNADSILYYNQTPEYIIQKNGDTTRSLMRCDHSRMFGLNDKYFLLCKWPPYLADSMEYYLSFLKSNSIALFNLSSTTENHFLINKSEGNIFFILNIEKDDPFNPNFYLTHYIGYNWRMYEPNAEIHDINDQLCKDTLIGDRLIYTITVSPYAGI